MALGRKGILVRRTRRRDHPRPLPVAAGGLVVVLVLAGAAFLATRIYNGVPGVKYATAYVDVPEVGNLLTHDQVRIHGVRVGQVLKRDVGSNGQPRITLQLQPGLKLRRGTTVVFRANGLLGARYVELTPGTGPELADGATLRGGEQSYTYGLPEALGTFDKQTRGALGDTLGGLGQGLLGRGSDLNDSIHILGTQAENFRRISRTIVDTPGAAAKLPPSLAAATAPLDRNRAALSEFNQATADALNPFVTERGPVRSTLAQGGTTLRDVNTGLTAGTTLVNSVTGLANEANRTLPSAPPGLRGVRDLLRDGQQPLGQARQLIAAAKPAVPGVLRITDSAKPVLKPLRTTLQNASPILRQVGRYGCDIRTFGATMRSMTGYTAPGSGPSGPSQAFRLQIIAPLSTDSVGIQDVAKANTRRGVVAPCTFNPSNYPQFTNPNG